MTNAISAKPSQLAFCFAETARRRSAKAANIYVESAAKSFANSTVPMTTKMNSIVVLIVDKMVIFRIAI